MRYIRVTIFDFKRYLKQAVNLKSINSLEGKIIKRTHSLEKRLSFENPNPKYGKSKVYQLVDLLNEYEDKGLDNERIKGWSLSVIHQMVESYFNREEKKLLESKIKYIEPFEGVVSESDNGGYFKFEKKSITNIDEFSFKEFAFSRHSIRSFVGTVPNEIIEKAAEVALKSPSNCNLQPIRIYQINNKEKLKQILQLQRGNKGFNSDIHQLIVFVANLSNYSGFRERNQCFIDTGIFSISFAYALHDLGYGSCMLNWASTVKEDKSVNNILNLPHGHIVTLTMAIGEIPETVNVPKSLRRRPKEIINVI